MEVLEWELLGNKTLHYLVNWCGIYLCLLTTYGLKFSQQIKYLQRSNFFLAKNSKSSPILNAIVKAFQMMKDGFRFKFGNGTTGVWYEPWLLKDPLCHLVPFVHIQDIDLQIKYVISNEGGNLQNVYTILLLMFKPKFQKPRLSWWKMSMIIWFGVIVPQVSIQQSLRIDGWIVKIHSSTLASRLLELVTSVKVFKIGILL